METIPTPKTTASADAAGLTVLTFQLDRQVYAVPITPIIQLIEMVTIIPLPQTSNGIEGIINVRGTMVPVVSLRYYVGLEKRPWALHTPIILIRLPDEHIVGLIVDEVLEVVTLQETPVTPATFLPPGLKATQLLRGVAYHNGQVILLLDHEHLFNVAQTQALAQAAENAETLTEEAAPQENPL
ncbi:MAG TPA: chemotaxis protein CheW [Anaerolineae bacterium]|nr:chemotaxis protein CheW [Anaerolineae bacterium]HQK12838.1 chemotaxis protein CheW [Anaerolineae bacterium]